MHISKPHHIFQMADPNAPTSNVNTAASIANTPPNPPGPPPAKKPRAEEPTIPVCFVPLLTGPRPVVRQVFRVVLLDELNDFFDHAYDQFVNLLYPEHAAPPAHIITQAQWTSHLRALFKSRLDHVFSRTTGVRPANRIPLAASLPLPRIIADVINCYGTITCGELTRVVIPQPEVPAQGVPPPNIDIAIQHSFAQFTAALAHRSFTRLSYISASEAGTGAYTIAVTNTSTQNEWPANPIPAASMADMDTRITHFYSWHSNFSPSDVLLAALMCNRYGRNLMETTTWIFTAAALADTPGIRTQMYSYY